MINEFLRGLPRIQVSARTERRTIPTKSGEPFEIREQVGYLESVDEYGESERQRISISLGRDADAYDAGTYVIGGDSFVRSKYGRLELARDIHLIALPEALEKMAEQESKRLSSVSAAA